MKEESCKNWEDFEEKVLAIRQEHKKSEDSHSWISSLLFRGQQSAAWTLQTTLERFGKPNFPMEDYYSILKAVKPKITSLTKQNWTLEEYDSTKENRLQAPQGYEFMMYLRHHGFPSPLLDWTHSPYVAAFFAFRSKLTTDEKDKYVAIYSFVEMSEGKKSGSSNEASIVGLGPNITTHHRHFTQQCEYTICKKTAGGNYVYCAHEEAFTKKTEGEDPEQDQLTKFILPKSARTKVLEKLNFMNVNAYSLFGNEESLMESLAYQEIEKRYP